MPRINVECLPVGEMQTNCYLVENTETKELIIADPGADAELIIRRVGGRRPVAVLLTHGALRPYRRGGRRMLAFWRAAVRPRGGRREASRPGEERGAGIWTRGNGRNLSHKAAWRRKAEPGRYGNYGFAYPGSQRGKLLLSFAGRTGRADGRYPFCARLWPDGFSGRQLS